MRLIDADDLVPDICDAEIEYGTKPVHFSANAIGLAPTVDAVEVIRCRECKHWEKGGFQAGDDVMHLEYGGYCPNSRFARYESDFCSYGEKKEGTGNEA